MKDSLFMVWRFIKVIFCLTVFLFTFLPSLIILTCVMIPWAIGGHNLYSYVRYSRKSTDREESDWNTWINEKPNIMLFPFPQILGKDLNK